MTLDKGKYKQYESILRQAFEADGVNGESIEDIDKQELKGWGVSNLKDRAQIFSHLQSLLRQDAANINNKS